MKSYTTGRNLYGKITRNTSTANLALGDELANDKYRQIATSRDWPWLQKQRTISSIADQQFYELPYDCDQVVEVSVIANGDTTRYVPRLSPSAEHWDRLNLSTFSSDFPEWYYVRSGQIGLWPTPSSTGNTIYIAQKSRVIDLSVADLTTSTVTSIANGETTLTVNAGLTTLMAGQWIRITYDGGSNTGDGVWYEIASITSSTVLELVRAYGGTTIAAGTAACTIAQMPLLPEAFHDMIWKGAAAEYWAREADVRRASLYEGQYEKSKRELEKSWSTPTTSMVIDDGRPDEIINPNLTISL